MARFRKSSPGVRSNPAMPLTEFEVAQAAEDATALVNKGVTLEQAGQLDKALAVYDGIVQRYGERPEADVAEQAATALVNKGVTLGQA